MHTQIVIFAASAWLALYTLTRLFQALTSPERSIPGPFIARFTKLWYFFQLRRGDFHLQSIKLHEKYGPVVRVAPGWYSLSIPDKVAFGIGSKFTKGEWYDGWRHPDPEKFTLFTDRNNQRHADTRKRFANLYSLSSLLHYEGFVRDGTALLTEKMQGWSKSGESVDMAHWFQCYALDVMAAVTYSSRFGFLDNGEDVSDLMATLNKNTRYSSLVGVYSWAHKYIIALGEWFSLGGGTNRLFLTKFVVGKIAARRAEREKMQEKGLRTVREEGVPADFLDRMLDLSEEDGAKTTPYHVIMMGMTNVIAGSDTTAVELAAMLYHLIRTPRAMAALRQELDTAVERSAEGEDGRLPYKEASKLPYLQAVIKEAMRMHGVAGLPLWREVPAGGALVAGHRMSAGSSVGIQMWASHHDKSVYGEDADVFRPERWLEAEMDDPERLREMDAKFVGWGLGSRTCVGKNVAMLELCSLIPELVSRFNFELDMREDEWKAKNFLFVKPEKLMVKVSARH